ncbi:aldose epimerase family protein [Sulfitobacter sp. S190]|uniref:aldose epimerase family protein n=1 Tax=Sulfitobacter sp. S190 TaxID=2867022 RepID=UPI0021A87CCD|nr:aldose epimerase family protein [Sulfitobacter sp. S190]UWR22048.1 galactose mutarotase [Sulfitobacter sp. S190]
MNTVNDLSASGLGAITVSGHGLHASVLPFGATLQDLRLAGIDHPLILALPPDAYREFPMIYAGAVVGRVAGRIAGGSLPWDGGTLNLPVNVGGHHLHGGAGTFAHRVWTVEDRASDFVTLLYQSPAGEEGYPAAVQARATYRVLPGPALDLQFDAVADADTILNMCHHPYFNLDGSATIDNHQLHVPSAGTYLPATKDAVPTGEIADVSYTPFDFRSPRAVGPHSFDNSLCLNRTAVSPLRHVATLSATGGPTMTIESTQAALHIYDGEGIPEGLRDVTGRRLGPRAALALEAQGWPDAPNNPHFPSITLKAGQRYTQTVRYAFG